MTKKSVGNILLIGGSLAAIAGTGLYFYQQWLLVDYLCYGIKGFRFNRIGLDNTIVGLNLKIENKNSLDIEIKSLYINVSANNVPITTISQDGSRLISHNDKFSSRISPYQTSTLPLIVSFKPVDVLGNIFNIVTQTTLKNISFRFEGKITIIKWGIPIKVPFDFSYTVKEMMEPSGTSICDKENKK